MHVQNLCFDNVHLANEDPPVHAKAFQKASFSYKLYYVCEMVFKELMTSLPFQCGIKPFHGLFPLALCKNRVGFLFFSAWSFFECMDFYGFSFSYKKLLMIGRHHSCSNVFHFDGRVSIHWHGFIASLLLGGFHRLPPLISLLLK